MSHMKPVRQTSPGIQDTVCNLPIEINDLTVQVADVQLTPSLGPVQRTISWHEFCDAMRLLVRARLQLLVGVSRGELLKGNRCIRGC